MNSTFDLLIKPWIPVALGGETKELGLREVLYRAHEITEVLDPLPIAEFGIYRLLVVLVMDVYEFKGYPDLEKLMDTGRFDPKRIDDYFGKWGDRFSLFDPEWPFLQTSGMDDSPERPFSGLLPSIPSGTAASHFHHFGELDFAVSPAVAARLLTTIAPFMTAGGAGLAPSINGAPPWYVLVNGSTLFHTLCLNCYVGHMELKGDAPPAWRNPLPPKSDGRCTKTSLPEALTWRPRQIQLIPGASGTCSVSRMDSPVLVRTMKFRAGASCDFTWTDPSVPYKITDKGPLVMRPQEGREIWRDTGPLALLRKETYKLEKGNVQFARPLLVDQFQHLVKDQFIREDTPLSLTIYGMRTDMKMKVFEWQKERLAVPVSLVVGDTFASFAQEAMDEAASVEYALKKAIKHLYPRDASGNDKALDTLIANYFRQYWSDLRPSYEDMLVELASIPAQERPEAKFAIRDRWHGIMSKTARRIFEGTADNMDTYGDNIQRQVEARRNLNLALYRLLETSDQKEERKKKFKTNTTSIEGGEKQ